MGQNVSQRSRRVIWTRDWTVDSVAVSDGRATLKYLAPYVMRGPVSDWRVTSCNEADSLDDARLVLQVKRSGTSRYRGLPLTVTEFIRRWLMHVLPAGLHCVSVLLGAALRLAQQLVEAVSSI